MNKFMVFIRTKNEPGAGIMPALVYATNCFNAIEMARAQYGNLLFSQAAIPVPA